LRKREKEREEERERERERDGERERERERERARERETEIHTTMRSHPRKKSARSKKRNCLVSKNTNHSEEQSTNEVRQARKESRHRPIS